SLAISTLKDGIHSLHIRFKDDSVKYSQAVSQFFYKYTAPVLNNSPVNAYKYWFDQNEAAGVFQNVSNTNLLLLNDALLIDALKEGIHTFSIRFRDTQGKWSSSISQFFYKYTNPVSSSRLMNSYKYWFDGNDITGTTHALPATQHYIFFDSLDISNLSEGLHTFSLRFGDDAGTWSSTVSQFFYKYTAPTGAGTSQITAYQYWYDSDFSASPAIAIAATPLMQWYDSLDLSSLKDGLHTFSVRFKNNAGHWSSSISHFFYISKTEPNISNRVTAYRYWFDDMDTTLNLADLVPFINPYVMDTHIPLEGVDSGRHVVHFQFKDEKGMWSMVTTDSLSTGIKATYTFNGNGNWSNAANWVNKMKPPLTIAGTYKIFIDPVPGGQCILDVNQQITEGAIFTVRSGKAFVIPGNLNINQ
ncbi:MAG TPA: hypothetical protein VLR49_12615, partial [Ferruginibacter sp.]|nr:hypothetical protein [Ferruginibacter sp.]